MKFIYSKSKAHCLFCREPLAGEQVFCLMPEAHAELEVGHTHLFHKACCEKHLGRELKVGEDFYWMTEQESRNVEEA